MGGGKISCRFVGGCCFPSFVAFLVFNCVIGFSVDLSRRLEFFLRQLP